MQRNFQCINISFAHSHLQKICYVRWVVLISLLSFSFSLYHPHPWRKMKTSLSLLIFVQLWSVAASRTPKQPLAQQMVRDLARPREIRRPRLRWFVSLCPSFCAADGAAQTVVPILAQTFISMTSRWHHFHAYLRVHDFFCLLRSICRSTNEVDTTCSTQRMLTLSVFIVFLTRGGGFFTYF